MSASYARSALIRASSESCHLWVVPALSRASSGDRQRGRQRQIDREAERQAEIDRRRGRQRQIDRETLHSQIDEGSLDGSSNTDFRPILAHEPKNFLLKRTEVDWLMSQYWPEMCL